MTFYYVGGDGGADGGDTARFASRQTGTFPASSYSTIEGVLDGTHTTTDIALGDTISVKDTYANSSGSTVIYGFHGTPGAPGIIVESVDATAAETPKAGATETTTGGSSDIIVDAGPGMLWFFSGINFFSTDNIDFKANQQGLFRSCQIKPTDLFNITSDGVYTRFEACDFNFVDSGSGITVAGGAVVEIVGSTTSGFASTDFIRGTSSNGGAHIYLYGNDFTNLSATASIIGNMGNAGGSDDNIIAKLHNNKMLSGQVRFEEVPSENGALRYFEAVASDDTDSFAYEYSGNYGQVLYSTSTYVTGDTSLEGPGGYSYQVNTTTNCSKSSPFRWMLPPGYTDLSVASTDTIRVRITSATALTQEDIAVFVGTSNTTTNTQMDFISTAESKAESSAWIPDHTATGGTALATDASEWTNAQTNEYAITATPTNVDATSPLYPTVWIEVYTDVTFFVSSQLVFEA